MRRNVILLLLWTLAIYLVTLATGDDSTPKPCQIQSEEGQLRCVVPNGYNVRSGDCPGNGIWNLYKDQATLEECAWLCTANPDCQAFLFYNNHRCLPKTKTCGTTSTSNPLNVFYDKVPSGYTMRPGDCPGNDIPSLGGNVNRQECAELCDSSLTCNAFTHYNNSGCFPKTTGCGVTSLDDSLNIFYDKVPIGYALRPGDCPGDYIWRLEGSISVSLCANYFNPDNKCISFMYAHDVKKCFARSITCAQPSTDNPNEVFYDKVPSGYAMRPGDCPGNDILSIHGFTTLAECATRCTDSTDCVSFMFYVEQNECYPKTKTCQTTDTSNSLHFFYDKIIIVQ